MQVLTQSPHGSLYLSQTQKERKMLILSFTIIDDSVRIQSFLPSLLSRTISRGVNLFFLFFSFLSKSVNWKTINVRRKYLNNRENSHKRERVNPLLKENACAKMLLSLSFFFFFCCFSFLVCRFRFFALPDKKLFCDF